MEYKVAPSYEGYTIEKVDEVNHKAYVTSTCWKCGGTGLYAWFGECFACGGKGKIGKWVKAYTPTEFDKYVTYQARAKEKRVKAAEARVQDMKDNSEKNKKEILGKLGFDPENPTVYLVAGGNTYDIKDELKTRGGRYHAAFNWYFTREVEVPEGFQLVPVSVDELYDWQPVGKRLDVKLDAKEIADAAKARIKTPSNSEFIGEVKERLRNILVTLTEAREISGFYGPSKIFTFNQGENVLTWITSAPPAEEDAVIGHEYLLTATVKDHTVYNGVKQTKVNRCVLKEVG